MDAPLCQSFHFHPILREIKLPPLSERLKSVGVDVDIDQVSLVGDGTLALGDVRVLLYIRDVSNYSGNSKLPKYHLTYCKTLERMHRDRRFARYVVANRDDGNFCVNLMEGNRGSEFIKLDVCQYCLAGLTWQGFSVMLSSEERKRRVGSFSLKEFFEKYPKDIISINPPHTSENAPLNEYSPDWREISNGVKFELDYQCQKCNLVLPDNKRRFLHVHHVNGLKYDNSRGNLKVVCVACHSDEPLHSHMKESADYLEFMAWSGRA